MTKQFWTTNDVATHLGLANAKSAAAQLSRWGIQPVARQPGRDGMNLYDPDVIEATVATSLGRGNHQPRTDTPTMTTDPQDNLNLPQHVIDYVTTLAPDFRRDTMLTILDREATEHDTFFRTGGQKNKVVRLCLPETTTVYACVSPSAAVFVMPESYVNESPHTYPSGMPSYPVKISFPRDDDHTIEEFHRLAADAFHYRKHGGTPGRVR